MSIYAEKKSRKSQSCASTCSSQLQSRKISPFQFVDNRPSFVSQRNLQKRIDKRGQSECSKLIQRRPTLPIQLEDHEFVALLTSGQLNPVRANIRDERRRADGEPQLLTMLEYAYQGNRVYVHIHTTGGGCFGHVDIAGGSRLEITSGQSRVILRRASESGIPTNYSGAGGAQDWETGEYGHETK